MNPLLRLTALLERLRGALWLLPTLGTVSALLLGTILTEVELEPESPLRPLLFSGDTDGARTLLSIVAGSMITLTGTVFSLTVVALQLAAGQYSPRLLRNFLRDRGNQVTLAVFVATFAYAVAVLRRIRGVESSNVPSLAITVGMFLVLVSIGMLVYFLHHLTESIRLEDVIRRARRSAVAVVEEIYPDPVDPDDAPPSLPEVPDGALEIPVPTTGYLQAVAANRLLEIACATGTVLRLRPVIGTILTQGTVLGWAWPLDGSAIIDEDTLVEKVRQTVRIGFERTQQQDVALGIRQLVDVAVKALSPGVNDPTTAVDVIGQLSTVLARLTSRRLDQRLRFHEGVLRVALPRPGYPAYLDLAVGQIRRYGANEPAVVIALLRLLLDLARLARTTEAHDAVQREARLVLEDAEREVAQPADLEPLRALAELVERNRLGGESEPEPTTAG